MTVPRLLIALTVVNLGLLVFLLAQIRPAEAESVAPMLRGRGLEIVDDQNRVRATIQLLPPTTQKNGERSADTVLLRLITERGRPSVKIAASEEEAGMSLTGPTGTKRTYVQLGSNRTTSTLTLKNEDGKDLVVKP
jgi:hypothetical protein